MRARSQGRPQNGNGDGAQTWLDFGTKLDQFLDQKWLRIRPKSGTESVPHSWYGKCTKNGGRKVYQEWGTDSDPTFGQILTHF